MVMKWVGQHVACRGEMRNVYKILLRKHERKTPLEKLCINQKIILRKTLEK
jgi:hypothetical protein